jgi:site-specific recombinase XerD
MTKDVADLFAEARPDKKVAKLALGSIVTEYLKLYAEGRGHTARAKQLDTDKFLEFLKRFKRKKEIDELWVEDWDFSATQRFIDEALRVGEAPATVSRRLATLKHMGRVLSERIPGFINPARDVKPPKLQTRRPKSINAQEVVAVKAKAMSARTEKNSFNRLRNETLLRLLLDTGLRAEEIRTIKISQLSDKLEWIRQVRTKGRNFRDVYITTEMRQPLQLYLSERARELGRFFPKLSASVDASLPLFISSYAASASDLKSFELSPKSVWRAIRSFSIDTKLHPHLLRHTYATNLLNDSRDIRLVAQALGHSDVRVTMRYTERGNEEVAEALERVRKNERSSR